MSSQPAGPANPAPMQMPMQAPMQAPTQTMTPPPAAAATAADVLTEKTARQKLSDAGYGPVSGLKRSATGEWEAMSRKDGKQTRVTIAADGTVTPGAPM